MVIFFLFGHATWPGIELTAPAMEAVFTTGPPGKSQKHFFFWSESLLLNCELHCE